MAKRRRPPKTTITTRTTTRSTDNAERSGRAAESRGGGDRTGKSGRPQPDGRAGRGKAGTSGKKRSGSWSGQKGRSGSSRGSYGEIGEGRILIHSFAKINFSIDAGEPREDGFHPVDMVMQQLGFHDNVTVLFHPEKKCRRGEHKVQVATNRPYLPVDRRNLAYRAAELMSEECGADVPGGLIDIQLHKMIPVAAGLAGGSGNAAAVLHALNVLWHCRLTLPQLMDLGAKLGSDVPFCIMGQARLNHCLPRIVREDPSASSCARAKGTGTELEPLPGIRMPAVIAKPRHGVSTAEVYKGLDECTITARPDNDRLAERLRRGVSIPGTGNNSGSGNGSAHGNSSGHGSTHGNGNGPGHGNGSAATPRKTAIDELTEDFINVLECYTLNAYPDVLRLKQRMAQTPGARVTLMSGSGPTVFSLYSTLDEAREACTQLRAERIEAYWTETVTDTWHN